MKLPFEMERDQRGIVIGRTGSGKTTLATQLISQFRPLLIIDPKGDFSAFEDERIYRESRPEGVRHSIVRRRNIVQYSPHPENTELEDYNQVFREAFWSRRYFVYIDEASCVADSPMRYPKYLRYISQQGRSMGVGLLAVCQDPVNVPSFLFSQADHYYTFRIVMQSHLEKVESWIGREALIPPAHPHAFWYRNVGMDDAELFVLQLRGSNHGS